MSKPMPPLDTHEGDEEAITVDPDDTAFADKMSSFVDQPPLELPTHTLGELLDDTSAVPDDIIAPRVLTQGGILVFGGPPKVGKSDFLIHMLLYMAAGLAFLWFKPTRPLRIFYLQAEIQYHYLRERLRTIRLDKEPLAAARTNLVLTPKVQMLLDHNGVNRTIEAIRKHFGSAGPDIICIDPIRNVFDGGSQGRSENDNSAMQFFIRDRVERVRDAVNPDAGVILRHHTRKISKKQLEEDPFMALSGAGSLRSFYSSGIIMSRPDETRPERKLDFELRNGPPMDPRFIDKQEGRWVEVEVFSERLTRKDIGRTQDAERDRRDHVILDILRKEARKGRLYTMNQYAEKFEAQKGLGGKDTILGRLGVLATKGFVKFIKDGTPYGLGPSKSKYGFLYVDNMEFPVESHDVDPGTGEVPLTTYKPVVATHYKSPLTGVVLKTEDPDVGGGTEE